MATKTTEKPRTKTATKTQRPPLWKVILLNDDYTPREFVVEVLKAVFRMNESQAYRVMMTAHQRGACVIAVYTKDVADTKAKEATEMGRARAIRCTSPPRRRNSGLARPGASRWRKEIFTISGASHSAMWNGRMRNAIIASAVVGLIIAGTAIYRLVDGPTPFRTAQTRPPPLKRRDWTRSIWSPHHLMDRAFRWAISSSSGRHRSRTS